ncbi:MAG: RAB protein geranylgeranyltransferase component A [Cyclobacteriaceae bacterium]|jgi:hypothetical protein
MGLRYERLAEKNKVQARRLSDDSQACARGSFLLVANINKLREANLPLLDK